MKSIKTCFAIIISTLFFTLPGAPQTVLAQPGAALPVLPSKGATINDFIPKGWELKDSAEFDFNGDGLMDIVAVIETPAGGNGDIDGGFNPRILFVLQNTGSNYQLSIQDENAVRSRDEGGIWGDPYEPLTTNGDAFTVNAYGGSNWRWAEHFTYKYRDNSWVLTQMEMISIFMAEIRSEYIYDYEQGRGHRMEMNDCGKSVTYEIKLDQPPTLKAYNLNLERPDMPQPTTFPVKAYQSAPDVNTNNIKIPPPPAGENLSGRLLNTKDYIAYRFFNQTAEYLAVYDKTTEIVHVVAQIDTTNPRFKNGVFDHVAQYRGRIYYSFTYGWQETELTPNGFLVSHYTAELVGINPDGSARATVFKHELDTTEEFVYLTLICEFSGGEAIVNVFGPDPQRFYRVNLASAQWEHLGDIYGCTNAELEAHQRELEGPNTSE